jgi:hypothetical protein
MSLPKKGVRKTLIGAPKLDFLRRKTNATLERRRWSLESNTTTPKQQDFVIAARVLRLICWLPLVQRFSTPNTNFKSEGFSELIPT